MCHLAYRNTSQCSGQGFNTGEYADSNSITFDSTFKNGAPNPFKAGYIRWPVSIQPMGHANSKRVKSVLSGHSKKKKKKPKRQKQNKNKGLKDK